MLIIEDLKAIYPFSFDQRTEGLYTSIIPGISLLVDYAPVAELLRYQIVSAT